MLFAHSDGESMLVQAVDADGEIHCLDLRWPAAHDLAGHWLRLALIEPREVGVPLQPRNEGRRGEQLRGKKRL